MEKRLNEILRTALHYRSSDIYFTLKEDEMIIEMKLQDRLVKLVKKQEDIQFFRYLQYRANLDVGNRMLPQTGQFEAIVDKVSVSLRLACVTSYQLETGVMRILNQSMKFKVEDLSSSAGIQKYLNDIGQQRSGLFIFSGPTGSGKTTTLYALLNQMNGKKIFTLEDPIEVFSSKYVQLQVNEKQNLSYANGIKQLMRHAPDVIMIGEIRDSEAASMAVRCALTGHLVVTSLHASSCLLAIERMIDLGVSRLQLRDVLKGVSNQRLYFSMDKMSKVGVYEKMDRKELEYYFEYGKVSKEFESIQAGIKKEINTGKISYLEAQKDLDD